MKDLVAIGRMATTRWTIAEPKSLNMQLGQESGAVTEEKSVNAGMQRYSESSYGHGLARYEEPFVSRRSYPPNPDNNPSP